MGYYANAIEGTIIIPPSKEADALRAMNDAIAKHNKNNEGKFAFWNQYWTYDNAENIREVLSEQGFDFETRDGVLNAYGFYGKWTSQAEFTIKTLAEYVTEDSYMCFAGEDYTFWKWTPEGFVEGKVVWE